MNMPANIAVEDRGILCLSASPSSGVQFMAILHAFYGKGIQARFRCAAPAPVQLDDENTRFSAALDEGKTMVPPAVHRNIIAATKAPAAEV